MFRKLAVICCGSAAAMLSMQLHAQFAPPRVRKLDIMLASPDCSILPKSIVIVYGNNDAQSLPAKQDPANPCHYTAEKTDGEAFLIGDGTHFSLRLGNARTDCRWLSEANEPQPPYTAYGTLRFAFESDSARDLTVLIKSAPLFRLRYNRSYNRNPDIPRSRDCHEGATVGGRATVRDVAFPFETIELQFTDDERIFIDDQLQNAMQWSAEKSNELVLDPAAIGHAYKRQVGEGLLHDGPPYLAGNAADEVAARLRAKKLASLTLKRE